MKRLIFACILMVLIGIIYFSGYTVTKSKIKIEREKLETCIELLNNGQTEEAIITLDTQNDLKRLTHYIYTDKITVIEENRRLAYYCLLENKTNEAIIYAKNSIIKLDDIENEFLFTPDVFF